MSAITDDNEYTKTFLLAPKNCIWLKNQLDNDIELQFDVMRGLLKNLIMNGEGRETRPKDLALNMH